MIYFDITIYQNIDKITILTYDLLVFIKFYTIHFYYYNKNKSKKCQHCNYELLYNME
jgi:hypothetical protein